MQTVFDAVLVSQIDLTKAEQIRITPLKKPAM